MKNSSQQSKPLNGHMLRHIPAGSVTSMIIWWVLLTIGSNTGWSALITKLVMTGILSWCVAIIFESITNNKGEGVLQVVDNPNSLEDIKWHMLGTAVYLVCMLVFLIFKLLIFNF